MYKRFYGLQDIPFSLAPDPKYLFRTESSLEVFANLQYGIENGKGIVVVTGEVGTGKTTILRSMLQSLDRSVLAAYIFNPLLSTQDFFDVLGGEFGFRSEQSKAAVLRLLGNTLMSRHARGQRTVLVVDEAHLLPSHLLEEIRLLSNFETNRDKLIQIIMCGQPELHELLITPELRQLKQRVSLKCSIMPLSSGETADYIQWRLRVAGAQSGNLFEPEAIRIIHRYSGGIPRIVNNICDNALLTGFSHGSPRITPSIVNEVIQALDLAPVGIAKPQSGADAGGRIPGLGQQQTRQTNSGHDAQQEQPSNVRYIRRELNQDNQSQTTAKEVHGTNYRLDYATEDDSIAPSRFFQRMRVARSS
jgi:general secretion pathway protein A